MVGKFKECSEGVVKWEDVEEQTFEDFWMYVYTDDYGKPQTSTEEVRDSSTLEQLLDREDENQCYPTGEYDGLLVNKSGSKLMYRGQEYFLTGTDPGRGGRLWKIFKSVPAELFFQGTESSKYQQGTWKQAEKSHDLIRHARLYIFANNYGIEGLMSLSVAKLHRNLTRLDLGREAHIVDVVGLIQLCYETLTPACLKQFVIFYLACKLEDLWHNPQLQRLLTTNGDLSRAVLAIRLGRPPFE